MQFIINREIYDSIFDLLSSLISYYESL